MNLPQQINTYFDCANGNLDALKDILSLDICIEDTGENTTICGIEQCIKWVDDVNKKYEKHTKVIDFNTLENGSIAVSTVVTGNFAVGGFCFDYFFDLENDKIKKIKIVYTGKQ
ncbi:MAG: hypothetical protein FWF58_01395 [Firmicutes bacterium]|nr:hypothetical protein [Bacillota bacterium]